MDEIVSALSSVSFGKITLFTVLSVVLVFLVCLIAIKIIMKLIDGVMEKSKLENGVKGFIRSGSKALLWIITIITIANRLGIDTTSLVALVSVAGLALSLSIQGTMSNLFSGITILTTKPFVSGDYVELDGTSGTVSEVGLFYTTMSTVDNKVIYVPNGQVTSAKIINYTRQEKRRVDISFSASYKDSTESVKAALMDAAAADERIIKDPAPFAGLLSYKNSSIEYVLRVWVKGEDYWGVYFGLNEKVRELFNERGIEMTYEHINVHMMEK